MKNLKLLTLIFFTISYLYVYPQDKPDFKIKDTSKNKYVKVIIRSAPKLTFELSGHYDYGVFELSANDNGDFSSAEFISGENFGVRHGFGITGVAKIPLHEKGNVRLHLSCSFNRFNSKYNKYLTSGEEGGYVSYNAFVGGIGIENNFTPNHRFKTLIGASFIGSLIFGDANVYDTSTRSFLDLKILPAFRLGISMFTGLEYLINNNLGLNFGFKITHANLWLKDSKVSDNPNEVYLNDKKVTPRIPYSGWRQFAWGSFYGGVNLYFGVVQKEYLIKKN
jgi:hypothetical protein